MICSILLSPFYPALIQALVALSDCTPKNNSQLFMKEVVSIYGAEQIAPELVSEYGFFEALKIARCE